MEWIQNDDDDAISQNHHGKMMMSPQSCAQSIGFHRIKRLATHRTSPWVRHPVRSMPVLLRPEWACAAAIMTRSMP